MYELILINDTGGSLVKLIRTAVRQNLWVHTIHPVDFQMHHDAIDISDDISNKSPENVQYQYIKNKIFWMKNECHENKDGFLLIIGDVLNHEMSENIKSDFGAFSMSEFGNTLPEIILGNTNKQEVSLVNE